MLILALFVFVSPVSGSDIGPPGEAPVIAQMNQETLDPAPDLISGLQSEVNVRASAIAPRLAGTVPAFPALIDVYFNVVSVKLYLMVKAQDAPDYLHYDAVQPVSLRLWQPEGGEASRWSMKPEIVPRA